MTNLFVELHDGDPEKPRPIWIAIDDIRLVSGKADSDMTVLAGVLNAEAYKTRIVFKGDPWTIFVHESPETVCGICGFGVVR